MPTVSDLFLLQYGHSLELNSLKQSDAADAVNFVSRTTRNNGVSARIRPIPGRDPAPSGTLSVALGGQGGAGETFVQPFPYYCGRDVMILIPRIEMSEEEKLWWATCITANRFRFGFGRQANRTLKDLILPDRTAIPDWVTPDKLHQFTGAQEPVNRKHLSAIQTTKWKWFDYAALFEIGRGKGPRIKDLNGKGSTPFVTSTEMDNGVSGFTDQAPCHPGGAIGVNRNGSVAEAFFQPVPFCSTEDVHIFIPKFAMSAYQALFLCTVIRMEKYRFGYGRKWGLERMRKSKMKLPAKVDGTPDWEYMEKYIQSLPFSSQIE